MLRSEQGQHSSFLPSLSRRLVMPGSFPWFRASCSLLTLKQHWSTIAWNLTGNNPIQGSRAEDLGNIVVPSVVIHTNRRMKVSSQEDQVASSSGDIWGFLNSQWELYIQVYVLEALKIPYIVQQAGSRVTKCTKSCLGTQGHILPESDRSMDTLGCICLQNDRVCCTQ